MKKVGGSFEGSPLPPTFKQKWFDYFISLRSGEMIS